MGDLWARLVEIVSLGRLTVVDDTQGVQLVQVTDRRLGMSGEAMVKSKIARVGQFGFTSNPPIDSDAVVLRIGGDRTLPVVIATSHPASRLKNLQPGDAALYDVRGAYVKLTADGLEIDCAGLPAKISNVSTLTVQGDLHVTGEVIAKSASSPVALSTHRHFQGGAGAPLTGQPQPQEAP